jgi:hypothetical protein
MTRQVRRKDAVATMMEITGDFFGEVAPLLLPMPVGGGAFIIVIVIVCLRIDFHLLLIEGINAKYGGKNSVRNGGKRL